MELKEMSTLKHKIKNVVLVHRNLHQKKFENLGRFLCRIFDEISIILVFWLAISKDKDSLRMNIEYTKKAEYYCKNFISQSFNHFIFGSHFMPELKAKIVEFLWKNRRNGFKLTLAKKVEIIDDVKRQVWQSVEKQCNEKDG